MIKQVVAACTLLSMLVVTTRADEAALRGKSKIVSAEAKTAQARREVQAVYNRQAAAMMRKDAKGFMAPFTRDYQDLKYGGQMYTVAHLRQVLPHLIAKYPPGFQFKTTIQKFRLENGHAKATANYHLRLARTDAQHHKQQLWTSDTVSQDTWIKSGSVWRLQNSRETQFTHKQVPIAQKHTPQRAANKTTGRTAKSPAR